MNETINTEQLADFFKEEPLCEELAACLEDGENFQMIRHPLVYSVPYSPIMNAHLNKQLEWKLDATEKALQEDDWSRYFWLHERPYRMQRFLEHAHKIDPEKRWAVFGSIWTDSENLFEAIPAIKMLLKSNCPHKEKMMDEDEREFLAKLPDSFKIYRGHKQENKFGFSWTLSPGVAAFFANRFVANGHIIEATCKKSDVIAVLLGRNEMEIVIDPSKLKCRMMKPLTRQEPFERIYNLAKEQFKLKEGRSMHGPAHWERVEKNVIAICKELKDADIKVCRCFAILHDSCRENESADPKHGQRAAQFVKLLYADGKLELSDGQLEQLMNACAEHNDGKTSNDPTIGACWDADRLDLPRVGISPDAKYFSTEVGKKLIWQV